MGTWDDTSTSGGGSGLLPEGTATYKIGVARVEVSDHGNKLRQAVIALSSPDGQGEVTIPLEPFDRSADGIEMWERIFKTAAVGLGFEPTAGNLPIIDVADEFARWLPQSGLVGLQVEAKVKHVEAKAKQDGSHLKSDGTPFKNHRVTFRGLVGGSAAPGGSAFGQGGSPAASFASVGAEDNGQDPWA